MEQGQGLAEAQVAEGQQKRAGKPQEIQRVAKMQRDSSTGSTMQEINFWLGMEKAGTLNLSYHVPLKTDSPRRRKLVPGPQ